MRELDDFELRKFVAPEFVFGFDARKLAGRYAKNFGARKVLVVTDAGVMAAGWTDDIIGYLRSEGIEYAVFDAVTSNPKVAEVESGADFYRRQGCNAIVAVGGGSPMDCAKGIGIVCANQKSIVVFEGVDQVEFPIPPLICIPTTAGSSADVSQFAIITDTLKRSKFAIISKMVVPDVALIDPLTTTTMDAALTASTGVDALCHAIEAFVSTAHSPITDLHALQAVALITSSLVRTIHKPDDVLLRGRMMLASLEAGLAFSNASLGAVHAMAHSLGGLLDCAHGECNAILLSHVIAFNFEFAQDRYVEIGRAMGLESGGVAPEKALAALRAQLARLTQAAGSYYSLSQLGVSRDDIPELAERALSDPCIFTNPRQPTQKELEAIYEQAF
jgi:alcohol dehydrogenase class IV